MSTERVGRYLLQKKIGRGATGEVFTAVYEGPLGMTKTIAIKLLFPSFGTGFEKREKNFINEAKLGALLKHPNIVEVYELGRHDDRLFLAMEYIEGFSLRGLLDLQKKLPLRIALRVLKDVTKGLAYAYDRKYQGSTWRLVHRDLKPANILVNRQGSSKL